MKAVVWTDVFQSVVMIAGLLAIMIQVLIFICLVLFDSLCPINNLLVIQGRGFLC